MIKINDQIDALPQSNAQLYWRVQTGEIEKIEQQLRALNDAQRQKLILNIDLWRELNITLQAEIDTIHLKQSQLMGLNKGELVIGKRFIAACHDAVSLQHAHHIGCDAVFLSPVNVTETHPNAKVLGWDDFAELAKDSDIPVFALGGVAPENLEQAQKHHAYGLAGIRQFSSID